MIFSSLIAQVIPPPSIVFNPDDVFRIYINPWLMHPSISGFIGSVLSLYLLDKDTKKDYFFTFLGGLASALIFAPFLAENLKVFSVYGPSIYGFMCGLLGMDIIRRGKAWVDENGIGAILSGLYDTLIFFKNRVLSNKGKDK